MATRIDSRDFSRIADYIKSEADERKDKRKDTEKRWAEVDQQLAMDEKLARKLRDSRTTKYEDADWIPALVLPQQATSLEVLTSDCRRLMLPDTRNWFECHARMSDANLAALEGADLMGVAGRAKLDTLDQETLDDICQAVLEHNHRKYDVGRSIDLLNAEALKYGQFVGRVKSVRAKIFSEDFRGVFADEDRFVAMVPGTIKDTYPDDEAMYAMGDGLAIQPSWVRRYKQRLADLRLAAARGSTDPSAMDGGWMKKNVSNLQTSGKGDTSIELIEFEGDVVIPRSGDDIVVFNRIVTIAVGADLRVVRYRELTTPYRDYIHGTYHVESARRAVGPLVMAAPLHNAMGEVFNQLIASAQLSNKPPVSYPADDRFMQSQGGPKIFPGALWMTTGQITPHSIGEPQELLAVFTYLLKMYEDMTGVTSSRTGAPTKSHQTAFAVDQEVSRGEGRTVDYVSTTLRGPFTSWLYMEWDMLRRDMPREWVYVKRLGGYIRISGALLPDINVEVFGSATPGDEAEKMKLKMQAMIGVVNLEEMAQKLGAKPLNLDLVREEMLRDGGWTDAIRYFQNPMAGAAQSPGGAISPGLFPQQLVSILPGQTGAGGS